MLRIKKYFLVLVLLILINGCKLTQEEIINNPELIEEKCSKLKAIEDKNNCFTEYGKIVANNNSEVSIKFCNNLEDTARNKCLFNVFSILETNNKIEEAIDVCKNIDKEGFSEWCETRRDRNSIVIAPSLE